MKHYIAEVSTDCPYPYTFTYRIDAANQGRAADFVWRNMRQESKCKRTRERPVTIKITPT